MDGASQKPKSSNNSLGIVKSFEKHRNSIRENLRQSKFRKSEDIVVRVKPDGTLATDWWDIDIDELLESFGVPEDDVSRNPLCG